jgi:exopolyphosphatase/guanosine-5'-triphosphate,3'-diphosphate pyrophosphatase
MHEQGQSTLAAIDVGSNTIHLLVAQWDARERDLMPLADVTEVVRLGEDVGAAGAIGPERMRRALEVIAAQATQARALSARTVLGLATEGVRAATNGDELLRRAEAEAGVTLHLLSGEQEAALTYWGATGGAGETEQPRAVIDLGGGSMELVIGQGTRIAWRVSLPLGAGALLAQAALSDPPTEAELSRVRGLAESALAGVTPPGSVEIAIACGGAPSLLCMLSRAAFPDSGTGGQKEGHDQPPGVIGMLSQARLLALVGLLGSLSSDEVAMRYGLCDPRVRLLTPGALALLAALNRLGSERLLVSRRGIREGALLAYLRRSAGWLEAARMGESMQ